MGESTSSSLIDRVRARDEAAWRDLVSSYARLIFHWCGLAGVSADDADDIAQEIFVKVIKLIDRFAKRPEPGGFRAWLRKIAGWTILEHRRRNSGQQGLGGAETPACLANAPDPGETDFMDDEEASDRVILLHSTLERIRPEFKERTWQAAMRILRDGRTAAEVAQELGMTPNAAYVAKSRVLSRLRAAWEELPP